MKALMEAVMEREVGCGVAVGRIVGLVGTGDFDFAESVDLSFVGIVYSGFAAKTVHLGSATGTAVDSGSTVGIEGSVGIADSDFVDDAAGLERSSVESV